MLPAPTNGTDAALRCSASLAGIASRSFRMHPVPARIPRLALFAALLATTAASFFTLSAILWLMR